ncbi:hypothetical protein [Streptomyces melanosporofaciens]|uniref:Uncharacterized protein n=1 Tax=Streptomyces melanosporofaciens TaxID=67327 RepID=A0A1H5BN11_STRMJ|nr:hypothetical protein SAMN04490356_8951 [Streptomyces melanosporofaciens]
MAAFDVNAARAQRLEALGLTWDFEVDGETFSLPTEIPRRSAHTLAELEDNDLDGLLALLSAFVRTREGEAAEWGLTAHLLAAVVDHLVIANGMFASANRDEYADPRRRRYRCLVRGRGRRYLRRPARRRARTDRGGAGPVLRLSHSVRVRWEGPWGTVKRRRSAPRPPRRAGSTASGRGSRDSGTASSRPSPP